MYASLVPGWVVPPHTTTTPAQPKPPQTFHNDLFQKSSPTRPLHDAHPPAMHPSLCSPARALLAYSHLHHHHHTRPLEIPTLIIQDPTDPITRLPFAQALAEANAHIGLAVAPAIAADDACVSNKGRWGTHVAAYKCHEAWTVGQLSAFLTQHL